MLEEGARETDHCRWSEKEGFLKEGTLELGVEGRVELSDHRLGKDARVENSTSEAVEATWMARGKALDL